MPNTNDLGTFVPSTDDKVQGLRSSVFLQSCAKCGIQKPKKEFRKRLTLAQTRALLRQPSATTRFTTTSKHCKTCREKQRSRKPLTTKQIRTRITTGDMPRIMGEMKLEKIRQDIPKKRSKVMKETWQKRKAQPHETLKRNLQDQVNRIGNRHFASKNLQDATRLQNAHNYAEAKRIMRDLLEQAQAGTNVPIDVQIATLIQPTKE